MLSSVLIKKYVYNYIQICFLKNILKKKKKKYFDNCISI